MSNEIAQLTVRVVACNRVKISCMSKIDSCEMKDTNISAISCQLISVPCEFIIFSTRYRNKEMKKYLLS